MNTLQITPTPDAVKLAGEPSQVAALGVTLLLSKATAAVCLEKMGKLAVELERKLDEARTVLTAQQAEHAATVARLEQLQVALGKERDEVVRLRGKADECWGAANYRLKYIGCLFRAAGLDDSDPLENRIGAAMEHIEKLVSDLSAARAQLKDQRGINDLAEAECASLRAQLTALRERAEGLAGALAGLLDHGQDHCDYAARCGLSCDDDRVKLSRAALSAYRAAEGKGEQG